MVIAIINAFLYLFGYEPDRTDLTCHDVEVGQARPIKQQPHTRWSLYVKK